MDYNNYIKQKIINVYLMKEKIGLSQFNIHIFKILDKYEFTPNIDNQITDLSYNSFNNFIKEISNSSLLKNALGIDFLENYPDRKIL